MTLCRASNIAGSFVFNVFIVSSIKSIYMKNRKSFFFIVRESSSKEILFICVKNRFEDLYRMYRQNIIGTCYSFEAFRSLLIEIGRFQQEDVLVINVSDFVADGL